MVSSSITKYMKSNVLMGAALGFELESATCDIPALVVFFD
jgi:hypothetical protein